MYCYSRRLLIWLIWQYLKCLSITLICVTHNILDLEQRLYSPVFTGITTHHWIISNLQSKYIIMIAYPNLWQIIYNVLSMLICLIFIIMTMKTALQNSESLLKQLILVMMGKNLKVCKFQNFKKLWANIIVLNFLTTISTLLAILILFLLAVFGSMNVLSYHHCCAAPWF
jgi:hypothetical protein